MERVARIRLIALLLTLVSGTALALDEAIVRQLAADGSDAKIEAINKLVAAGDPAAIPLLQAMLDDALATARGRVLIGTEGNIRDALTGEPVAIASEELQPVMINNRLRAALGGALAALRLSAPQREVRLAAAQELAANPGEEMLARLVQAHEKEGDAQIKALLAQARATLELKSPDPVVRRAAAEALGASASPNTRQLLMPLLAKNADGSFIEPDAEVRAAAQRSLRALEQQLFLPNVAATLFSGLSLGSVLLLAALGLAITFGLMGIINMAHGELLMIGAYTTYVVQALFRQHLPGAFDAYLAAAVPAAFLVSALVGVALERGVIRFLYGRPLETLLATWGISLMLIQLVRMLFGAQNVEVSNPSWMSGGLPIGADVVLPYNRMVIVVFAALVVLAVWLLLNRTRLGLHLRAVTQNRAMADCMGIATPRVDALTFGLGCGIAGLGGVALSQIGNVGPDLGQAYIVDSFMVVVLGGVGQLAGTIIAAIGLGEVNKLLEPYAGAVLGKIIVLAFIILFIQKRPQGLFALPDRTAEG
ncbi:MAG: urea ABC transporter permease subunit UrtB [Nitrospira sp.]|nr:urea ABC transporter permease subunit UrtB [Nitrospira sp.]